MWHVLFHQTGLIRDKIRYLRQDGSAVVFKNDTQLERPAASSMPERHLQTHVKFTTMQPSTGFIYRTF